MPLAQSVERKRRITNERRSLGTYNFYRMANTYHQNYLQTVLAVKYRNAVRTKNVSDKIQITVNGNGIPDSIKDKIFQPFFTTKPTGEGTGLGLSMSYDIITKGHGGELKVETKEGEFAEFTITLPV